MPEKVLNSVLLSTMLNLVLATPMPSTGRAIGLVQCYQWLGIAFGVKQDCGLGNTKFILCFLDSAGHLN